MGEDVERRDIEALLATRRELGADYDDALVAAFAERVEHAIAERTGSGVSERRSRADAMARHTEGGRVRQFVLGVISVGVGVPITIVPTVAVDPPNLWAVALGWLGIAAVNAAHASTVNGPRRGDDRR